MAFLSYSIEEQVIIINELMRTLGSLSKAAEEVGVSKSIGGKYKKYGYVLENGQYIKGENFNEEKVKKISPVAPVDASSPKVEKNKLGRKPKEGNWSKHNITIQDEVWQELQVYCIYNKTTISDLLNDLAKKFIKKEK